MARITSIQVYTAAALLSHTQTKWHLYSTRPEHSIFEHDHDMMVITQLL